MIHAHKHRLILAAVKVLTFVAWLKGVPDPVIAAVVVPWTIWFGWRTIRDGLREQYRLVETPAEKAARYEVLDTVPVRLVARPLPATYTAPGQPKPLARAFTERAPHELALP